MSKQPEARALQMAKQLRRADLVNAPFDKDVADMLERLHALNADLLEALQLAQGLIAIHCGTPDPEDRFADAVVISVQAHVSAALKKATEAA